MYSYKEAFERGLEYLADFKENINRFEPNHLVFLLQEGIKLLLKSVLYFYEVNIPPQDTIEALIDTLESKTTIKLPQSIKEQLYEIEWIYCEGGCSNDIGNLLVKEKLNNYIQEINYLIEDLKEFVIEEIGIENLK